MFDLDSCVCFITNKVSKMMADEFNDRLMKHGVTRVQWIAMYYLLKHGRLSQKELGEKMSIKESTVVRLIDRMEKEEYIGRKKDDKDRRISYIILTKKGKNRIEGLLVEGQRMSEDFSKEISSEEIVTFNRVLEKFMTACKKT